MSEITAFIASIVVAGTGALLTRIGMYLFEKKLKADKLKDTDRHYINHHIPPLPNPRKISPSGYYFYRSVLPYEADMNVCRMLDSAADYHVPPPYKYIK